jgi:beta-lactam-binding protein with PASTA domain
MPDLTGKSLKAAVALLPSSTSISAKDISGQHRLVIIQSNWKVCSQNPKPGAQFNGHPVTFGVVKFGEPCP